MAKFILRNSGLFVGETNLGVCARTLGLDLSTEIKDATTFESLGKEKMAGFTEVRATAEGFWSTGDDSLDDDLFENQRTSAIVPITITPEGNTAGNDAMIFEAVQATYNFFGAAGDVTPFTLELEGWTRCLKGAILHKAVVTANGSGAGFQLGAVAAGKSVYAALHVYEHSATNLDVFIQSDDNSGFTSPLDRINLSGNTARVGRWSSAAGPITDDWWRADWEITGASPSAAFAVSVAIF